VQHLPPLSLYIHIPWCVRKCPYCDFNSHEKTADFACNEKAYVDALLRDLEHSRQLSGQHKLESLFFGGGTPSLFSAESIQRIIRHAASLFMIDDAEITLEANPGTFEQAKFAAYHDVGINRLSIGIQSFNNHHLQSLGRIHDAKQAYSAINMAKQAGFENINLDIMFGLPQQSIQQAVDDIRVAIEHQVNHISHYQLTIEPNTYFHKHQPVLPDPDNLWAMQTQCQQQLDAACFQQYEVSAYAKSRKQCQHNLNYWLFGDYIGIGAGAHSKLTASHTQQITRYWKHRQPEAYMTSIHSTGAIAGKKRLTKNDTSFEFLLNALRLKQGCKPAVFNQHTGLSLEQLQQYCKTVDTDLLTINSHTICTTDRGFRFLNELLEQLL